MDLASTKINSRYRLIGLPNAGKSTLLSRITAAKPKIADTLYNTHPNLGL